MSAAPSTGPSQRPKRRVTCGVPQPAGLQGARPPGVQRRDGRLQGRPRSDVWGKGALEAPCTCGPASAVWPRS